jgi:Uma2 family endonuclease
MLPLPVEPMVMPEPGPLSPRDTMPTMYDLPSENPEEPGLPDEFHDYQPQLLRETFRPTGYEPEQVFTASDLNLYYDPRHMSWYKRPDWFAVIGVDRLYDKSDLRLSYVIWQEGVAPYIVIELLSPGTEKEDLGQLLREIRKPPSKWEVYERILRIPYYFVFSRYTGELQAFALNEGRYRKIGQLPIFLEKIGLRLAIWEGCYQGIENRWLRWQDAQGQWIPTPEELLKQADSRAEQERQRAERLAAQLRALGVEPE